jgi:uncharacterized membrane protein
VSPLHTAALTRVAVAAVVGVAVAIASLIGGLTYIAPQAGWDALALTYLGLTLPAVWRLDAAATARKALREDTTRPVADVLLLAAAVASLGALGVVIVRASTARGVTALMLTTVCLLSVVLSWALVHVTYMLRYARLYYTEPMGGVSFNDESPPAYEDFAYLAFTIGMTFQVSDTALSTRAMRSTALRHALLSYLFGTVILATTVNFVAGLAR